MSSRLSGEISPKQPRNTTSQTNILTPLKTASYGPLNHLHKHHNSRSRQQNDTHREHALPHGILCLLFVLRRLDTHPTLAYTQPYLPTYPMAERDIHPTPIPDTLHLTDGTTNIDLTKTADALTLTIHHAGELLAVRIQPDQAAPHIVFTYGRLQEQQATPLPLAPEVVAPAEHPTVSLSGFIGRNPSFRPNAERNLVYLFPLGVHPERGVTLWYDVYATEELTKRYKSLEKGNEVEVTGEDHTHTKQKQNSEDTRTVYEIHATDIAKIVTKRRKERE